VADHAVRDAGHHISTFLFDPEYLKKRGRIDALGLVLMVVGFGCLQLVLDRGEHEDWFDSGLIVALAVIAFAALVGFVIRELTASNLSGRVTAAESA